MNQYQDVFLFLVSQLIISALLCTQTSHTNNSQSILDITLQSLLQTRHLEY